MQNIFLTFFCFLFLGIISTNNLQAHAVYKTLVEDGELYEEITFEMMDPRLGEKYYWRPEYICYDAHKMIFSASEWDVSYYSFMGSLKGFEGLWGGYVGGGKRDFYGILLSPKDNQSLNGKIYYTYFIDYSSQPEKDILDVIKGKEKGIIFHPAHNEIKDKNIHITEGIFDHPNGTGVWKLKSILKGRGYSILVSLSYDIQDYEEFFLKADSYLKEK